MGKNLLREQLQHRYYIFAFTRTKPSTKMAIAQSLNELCIFKAFLKSFILIFSRLNLRMLNEPTHLIQKLWEQWHAENISLGK